MGLAQKLGARTVDSDLPEGVRRVEGNVDDESSDDADDDQNVRGATGIDGLPTDDDLPVLDADDVAILLRANQLVRGAQAAVLAPVRRRGAGPVADEAVGADRRHAGHRRGRASVPSITLAGDTSQRLFLDNGFGDWRGVLGAPGPRARRRRAAAHRLPLDARDPGAWRATRWARWPIPIRPRRRAAARRSRRSAFPASAPRWRSWPRRCASSSAREPRATVALLARHPEQADRYFDGLRRAEVPALRRVRAQEFAFRPGVEVTDVRQVKGLEFDYVVMLDVNATSYGRDDESRHLFHIGVTRAAHQLWLVVTGAPSPLAPTPAETI